MWLPKLTLVLTYPSGPREVLSFLRQCILHRLFGSLSSDKEYDALFLNIDHLLVLASSTVAGL
jgi:hypothetical protein